MKLTENVEEFNPAVFMSLWAALMRYGAEHPNRVAKTRGGHLGANYALLLPDHVHMRLTVLTQIDRRFFRAQLCVDVADREAFTTLFRGSFSSKYLVTTAERIIRRAVA